MRFEDSGWPVRMSGYSPSTTADGVSALLLARRDPSVLPRHHFDRWLREGEAMALGVTESRWPDIPERSERSFVLTREYDCRGNSLVLQESVGRVAQLSG